MGGESLSSQPQDHLLIIWAFPPPEQALAELSTKLPNLKITFKRVSFDREDPNGSIEALAKELTDEFWLSITHLCTMAHLPPPSILPSLTNLRLVQFTSSGINHIAKHPLYTSSEIPLLTVSGIHGPPISEWVVLQILGDGHAWRTMEKWQSEKKWGHAMGTDVGTGLRDGVGKRVGILGYGSIGRQSARVLDSMGFQILAYTATPRPTPESRRDTGYIVPGTLGDVEGSLPIAWYSGLDKESLHAFLSADLDYLLISLPLTTETTHLLGKEEFEILGKSNAFLLNISRGAIVDQPELIHALKKSEAEGGLRGAALDVTDPEPLPAGHELWDLPNVSITPHISALNGAYWSRALRVLTDNLEREKDGKELVNVVDRRRGY